MRDAAPSTSLFRLYCARLVVRAVLFLVCVYVFVTDRAQLDPVTHFGLDQGVSLVNFAFVVMLSDLLTKFFERAHISMGSLKQYRRYQIPTTATAGAAAREVTKREVGRQAADFVRDRAEALRGVLTNPAQAGEALRGELTYVANEFRATGEVSLAYVRRLLNNRRFLDFFRFNDEYLRADAPERARLRARRLVEIVPVIVFWVVLNAAVAVALALTGNLSREAAFLWSTFYFFFDVFSVVVWCPIQLLFMRNRCCATCQIFNWDGIMAATPLVFVGGWFSWIILFFALVVLARWELAAALHPERFSESANARLSCAQCTERLCQLRGKVDYPAPLSSKAGISHP